MGVRSGLHNRSHETAKAVLGLGLNAGWQRIATETATGLGFAS